MRKEKSGKIANRFGIQEIELHKALNSGAALSRREAHAFRHFALQIKGQPVFGASGDIVHLTAN